jgi:hypothetical protein
MASFFTSKPKPETVFKSVADAAAVLGLAAYLAAA